MTRDFGILDRKWVQLLCRRGLVFPAFPEGDGYLGAVLEGHFRQDVADVVADRAFAEVGLGGYLAVVQAFGH